MSEIWQLQASDIAARVRAGGLSAVEVTEAHLERLGAVNPAINAVVQEFPEEALDAAKAVDAALARGDDLGPMAGVPITIKVIVDQKGHATTNGLRLQKDLIAEADNPVVANLRKAGAVIVGRTNTPAFSMRWFTKNELHGQTLNPRNTALTPGGSSGGAAASVAAGICAMGHGTDIAGSVRYPAYACGLQGLRPSLGRIPAWNPSLPDLMIGAQLMAVSGPIARSIADLRLSFHAMAAGDVGDPRWVPMPFDLGEVPRRAVVSLAPDGMEVEPEVQAALLRAAEALREAGWEVEERDCPPMRAAGDINADLWMAEGRLNEARIHAEEDPDADFVFDIMKTLCKPQGLPEMMEILRNRLTVQREWFEFLETTPLILCPNSGVRPFPQQEDVRSEDAFMKVWEAQLPQRALPTLGVPCMSVATEPAGDAPMGVQLVAGPWREDVLFQVGAIIEAACGVPGVSTP